MKETISVSLIMKKDPICVTEEAKLVEIIDLMHKHAISHLPVVRDWRLVGIISKEDLVNRLKQLAFKTTGREYSSLLFNTIEAKNLMTSKPISVQLNDSLAFASELILQGKFHSLPVIDENERPVGIITASDLLKVYYQHS